MPRQTIASPTPLPDQPHSSRSTVGAAGIGPPKSSSTGVLRTLLPTGVGVRESATASPTVALMMNSSVRARRRNPALWATMRRRCRCPNTPRTTSAATLSRTSRPYAEPNTSPSDPSRTEALIAPEAPMMTNDHSASVEKRAIAASRRLLPRRPTQAERGEAADPHRHADEVQQQARRGQVVRAGRRRVAGQRDRRHCRKRETQDPGQRRGAERPPRGDRHERRRESLQQDRAPLGRPRVPVDEGPGQPRQGLGEGVCDLDEEVEHAGGRPHDGPTGGDAYGLDGEAFNLALCRWQQEHRRREEPDDQDGRHVGQQLRERHRPAHEAARGPGCRRARSSVLPRRRPGRTSGLRRPAGRPGPRHASLLVISPPQRSQQQGDRHSSGEDAPEQMGAVTVDEGLLCRVRRPA